MSILFALVGVIVGAEECLRPDNFLCPQCDTTYEPVCVGDVYTSCNKCWVGCEQEGVDPRALRLVDGECDNICTQSTPCAAELACRPVVHPFAFTFDQDTEAFHCVNETQYAQCPLDIFQPVCLFGELNNPGSIVNECIALAIGFDPSVVEAKKCSHICDTGKQCGSHERCLPFYDELDQPIQEAFHCQIPSCSCAPVDAMVCAFTATDAVRVELPNECVARCEGFTRWTPGPCPSSAIVNSGGYLPSPAGGPALAPLDRVFNGVSDYLDATAQVLPITGKQGTCGCDPSEFNLVCVGGIGGISFQSSCWAQCNGYTQFTPGPCTDACFQFPCEVDYQCAAPFPSMPLCVAERQACLCPASIRPVCVRVGAFAFTTYNDCTARCAGFLPEQIFPGECVYSFEPLVGLKADSKCTAASGCPATSSGPQYCSTSDGGSCWPLEECRLYSDAIDGNCCHSAAECFPGEYCASDGACYPALECLSYLDAFEGPGRANCPDVGCTSHAGCEAGQYCRISGLCASSDLCVNDSFDGVCPSAKCQSHASCGASQYCSRDGSCYPAEECCVYNDGVPAQCPASCQCAAHSDCSRFGRPGTYCAASGDCYPFSECWDYHDAVDQACAGPAPPCPDGQYRSNDDYCYDIQTCCDYRDARDFPGGCPPRAGCR